jgi:hypothetical protein
MCLLYEHGGMWLDSTVLLTAPLPDYADCAHGYYSPKCQNDIWHNVNEKRWLIFYMYMTRGNLLADFSRAFFFDYFKRHSAIIEYYMLDFCIATAYENIPAVQNMIDSVPPCGAVPHAMRRQLESAYNAASFEELCRTTPFHKLTRDKEFSKRTPDGRQTLYGWLVNQ